MIRPGAATEEHAVPAELLDHGAAVAEADHWTPGAVLIGREAGSAGEPAALAAALDDAGLPWALVGGLDDYPTVVAGLGVDPSTCAAVAADAEGVGAARRAGLLAIGVGGATGDVTLRDLAEVEYFLGGLFAP